MGRKKNKPSDNIASGIFHIMRFFKSYKLSDIFSDDFTVPQYIVLIDLLSEYYKDKEKAEKNAMKSSKGKGGFNNK